MHAVKPDSSHVYGHNAYNALVEKSTGNIKKAGNTDIQGIIGFFHRIFAAIFGAKY